MHGRLRRSTANWRRCGAFFCDTAAWDIPVVFDGVHFSEDGHRRFAKQMQRVLDTVFR